MPSNRQTGTVGGWSVLTSFITHIVRGNHQTKKLSHNEGHLSDNFIDKMLNKCPYEPRVTFWVKNALSGLKCPFWPRMPFHAYDALLNYNALLGHECPIRPMMPFWSVMPLRATNALSGQACSFGPKMPFQASNTHSGRDCPFGPWMIFWATDNIQPQQASYTLLFLYPSCAMGMIKWTKSDTKAVCHGILHGILTAKITESHKEERVISPWHKAKLSKCFTLCTY